MRKWEKRKQKEFSYCTIELNFLSSSARKMLYLSWIIDFYFYIALSAAFWKQVEFTLLKHRACQHTDLFPFFLYFYRNTYSFVIFFFSYSGECAPMAIHKNLIFRQRRKYIHNNLYLSNWLLLTRILRFYSFITISFSIVESLTNCIFTK